MNTPSGAQQASAPDPVVPGDGLVVGEDGLARPPWAAKNELLRDYYDTEWGMPVLDEQGMFERLSLEAFQSGLSWLTILRKRPAFRSAFEDFAPDRVACYGEQEVARLLADPGIVRNRQKIQATITNAEATVRLRDRGGLVEFIWAHQPDATPEPQTMADVPTTSPESVALARALRREGFTFVGPTTMFALLEATGVVDTHLMAAHRRSTSGVWPR